MFTESKLINIEDWVDSATSREAGYRACVHIILMGISLSHRLADNMIMKGGSLLALRYKSKRHTTDVDFSTKLELEEQEIGPLLSELSDSLERARVVLGYNQIRCAVQSHKIKPGVSSSFPTLQIRVGYANSDVQNEVKRLEEGRSSRTVRIDYSFNEKTYNTEKILLSSNNENYVQVYSIHDLMAEKYRALIQQKIRKRNRFQDVYDLNFLIVNHLNELKEHDKKLILLSMREKFKSRGLAHLLDPEMLEQKEIIERSKANYFAIADTIPSGVPEFEEAYKRVSEFLWELPWSVIYP